MKKEQKAQAAEVLWRLITQSETLDRQLEASLFSQGLSPAAQALLPELGQALDPARLSLLLQTFEPQLPSWGQSYEQLQRPSLAALAAAHRGPLLRC